MNEGRRFQRSLVIGNCTEKKWENFARVTFSPEGRKHTEREFRKTVSSVRETECGSGFDKMRKWGWRETVRRRDLRRKAFDSTIPTSPTLSPYYNYSSVVKLSLYVEWNWTWFWISLTFIIELARTLGEFLTLNPHSIVIKMRGSGKIERGSRVDTLLRNILD